MIFVVGSLLLLILAIGWGVIQVFGGEVWTHFPAILFGLILLCGTFWWLGLVSVLGKAWFRTFSGLFFSAESTKRLFWTEFYDALVYLFPQPQWRLMNHGFASETDSGYTIKLSEEEEFERYGYQLYHYIGTGMKEFAHFMHLDILEVGCGRGGGLAFLTKYLHPQSALGIDAVQRSIAFCTNQYRTLEGIQFLQGDAEAIPVPDKSKDLVIDIGNSHCYGSLGRYLQEVVRVLRPGGKLLFADFRSASEVNVLETALQRSGLVLEQREDISRNVYKALEYDDLRRLKLIKAYAYRRKSHAALIGIMEQFAGTKKSDFFQQLHRGQIQYMAYKLTKAA